MKQISFVILHYKTQEVTEKCIELLLNQDYKRITIVIVDNNSSDGSYEYLKALYSANTQIEVITTEQNYGFAKGNDLGYLIAKYKYNADYIVVMNNDVMIEDADFCNKLLDLKDVDEVGVIGPDIVKLNGEHQNPSYNCVTSERDIKRAIRIDKIKIFLIPFLYKVKKKVNITKTNSYSSIREYNVPLHGACIIFKNPFIEKNQYAFYPDTFLYGEEEFLYFRCRKQGIMSAYDPSIVVNHLEDVTTNRLFEKSKEKRLFELRNAVESLELLDRYLNRK